MSKVQEAINEIRGLLARDGGDIELISVKEGVVRVKLRGACSNCPMARQTLEYVVSNMIKKKVPSIKRVERA